MKKLFTLFVAVVAVAALFAQTNTFSTVHGIFPMPDGGARHAAKANGQFTKPFGPRVINAGNRTATTSQFILDYDGYDAGYATANNFDHKYALGIFNRNAPVDSVGYGRYAVQFFDTLVDIYTCGTNNVYPNIQIPQSAINSLTIDTINIVMGHIKASPSGRKDSMVIRIFDNTAFNNVRRDTGIVGTPVWSTVILWDSSVTGAGSQPGTIALKNYQIPVGFSMPSAHLFSIQVDFYGPVTDEFYIYTGYRDDCAGACPNGSSPGIVPSQFGALSSLSCLDFGYSGTTPQLVFNDELYLPSCNSAGPDPAFCNFDQSQYFNIAPVITVGYVQPFSANIVADSLQGCPGGTFQLYGSALGAANSICNPTYSWSTSSGQLSTTSGQQVSLSLGSSNAVITVTVTDGSSNTVTASTTIVSKGINVSILNANPVVLTCGADSILIAQLTGNVAGKSYSWNTTPPVSGANAFSVHITTPGTYTVTATNSSHCKSVATVTAVYNGVSNSVKFSNPPSPVCSGKLVTFTNQSDRTAGWNYTWTFGDGNGYEFKDGLNTYATAGQYTVVLAQDSGGCIFSAQKTVNVISGTNPACANVGIENVEFTNAVTLLPNPTNGNLNVTVSAVEKNLSIRMYNIIGSEVLNYSAADLGTTFSNTFDLSHLANGTYLVKIQSADKIAIKRVIVNK